MFRRSGCAREMGFAIVGWLFARSFQDGAFRSSHSRGRGAVVALRREKPSLTGKRDRRDVPSAYLQKEMRHDEITTSRG